MIRLSLWLATLLLVLCLVFPGKPGWAGDHQYLMLKDERHFYRNTVLGFIPDRGAEEHVLSQVSPLLDTRLRSLTGGRMVTVEQLDLDDSLALAEVRGLFDYFRRIGRSHLRPGHESDFFESRRPDFALGPVLDGIETEDGPVDRAIMLYFAETYVEAEKAYDLRPSAPRNYWHIDLCVFDLRKGVPVFCSYGGEDESLRTRQMIFRKTELENRLDEIFFSSDFRVTFGEDQ